MCVRSLGYIVGESPTLCVRSIGNTVGASPPCVCPFIVGSLHAAYSALRHLFSIIQAVCTFFYMIVRPSWIFMDPERTLCDWFQRIFAVKKGNSRVPSWSKLVNFLSQLTPNLLRVITIPEGERVMISMCEICSYYYLLFPTVKDRRRRLLNILGILWTNQYFWH